MKKRKSLIVFLLVVIMVATTITPAFAWKLNTHVYSGNLILEDLKDGYLEIDGVGTFKVPTDIYSAVTKYPASYRAGTLGPDIFPEMATGQGNIHPMSQYSDSGKYLQLLVDAYHKLPSNHPQREKIFAFILGYSTHYAGDLFGHSFINEWAQGVFPSMSEMATDSAKVNIALRHIASEGYVDSMVPDYQRTGGNIYLDAPIEFIKEVLIDEAAVKYEVSPYLGPITELRNQLKKKSETLKAYTGGDLSLSSIAKYGIDTNIAGYAERWQKDIDTGLVDWVSANQKMAQAMIDKDKKAEDALEPISEWVSNNGMIMSGSPDLLAKALGFSIDTVLQLINLITTQEIRDKVKEMKNDAIYWAIEEATGVDIDEMMKVMKDPKYFVNSPLFDTGAKTSNLIDQQLKNFGKTDIAKDIEFDPFYNTVQMGKLLLLGYNNLNSIFPNSKFSSQQMVESFNKIDIKIHTGKNASRKWNEVFSTNDKFFKGSDDDIFFFVKLKDGTTHEKLMDRPGYNDFESDDTDTYTLELPRYVTYQEISSVGVRKSKIVNDNWYPDWIEVKASNGKLIADSGYTKSETSFNKVFKGNDSWNKYVSVSDSIVGYSSFDPTIITFIKSLDDSEQWIYSKMYNNDKTAFDKVFRNYNGTFETTDISNENETNAFEGATEWAIPELKEAFDLKLFTEKVMGNYTANITRLEFAGLAVKLYEALTGVKAFAADTTTFIDSIDDDVLKAYQLKIVGGVGEGKFAPDNLITREQMAIMYYNTIKAAFEMKGQLMPQNDGVLTVNDKQNVSTWAANQVDFVFDEGIITGDGISFNPKGNASREAAIAVVKRVFKKYNDYLKLYNSYPAGVYIINNEKVNITNITYAMSFDYNNGKYYSSMNLSDLNGVKTAELKLNDSGTSNGTYILGNYFNITEGEGTIPELRIINSVGNITNISTVFIYTIDGQKYTKYRSFNSIDAANKFILDAVGGTY